MKEFRYTEFVKVAWEKVKKNYGMILLILVFLVAINIAFAYFGGTTKKTAPMTSVLLQIISYVISIFFSIGFIRCLLRAADDEDIIFSELFSGGDIFPKFFLGTMAYVLVVLGGYILLIVPCIIWAIKYSFVKYLIVDKGLGIKEAFSRSGQMTNGYKGNLFALGAFLGLINLAGFLCLGVGLFVTIPISMMVPPLVYRYLSEPDADPVV